jgi:hypothetical protein
MLSKYAYLKILASKPEIFEKSAEAMLPEGRIEDLRHIPNLGVCEISSKHSNNTIYEILKMRKLDAVVPTVCYRGTENVLWEDIDTAIKKFKRSIEKKLNIYVTEPVFLGSPKFWWALNGRFMADLHERFGFYTQCCGCRVYTLAMCVPLCKAINARCVIADDACGFDDERLVQHSDQSMGYYRSLMSSFGIELWYIESSSVRKQTNIQLYDYDPMQEGDFLLSCVLKGSCRTEHGSDGAPASLRRYFEAFAIPAAAKIISRALSGVVPDYLMEVKDTLLPEDRRSKRPGIRR